MSIEKLQKQQSVTRRGFLKAAAAVGGTAALAACAPVAGPEAGGEGAMADEPVELEISILAGAPVEPVNELIKASFNEKHPDVTVTFNMVSGDLAEKYYTAAAAGTLSRRLLQRGPVRGSFCQQQRYAGLDAVH